MSSSEIAAMVKDKSGSVICLNAIGPYGTYSLKSINLDQNVVKDGGLSVTDDCKVSITTAAPPRPQPVTIVPPSGPILGNPPVPVIIVPSREFIGPSGERLRVEPAK